MRKKSTSKKTRSKEGVGEIASRLRVEARPSPVPKKIRLRGPAPSRKLVRQIASLSKRNRRPDRFVVHLSLGGVLRDKRGRTRTFPDLVSAQVHCGRGDGVRLARPHSPDPRLQSLFEQMADDAPGLLTMTSFKTESVRLCLDIFSRPGHERRTFEVRLSRTVDVIACLTGVGDTLVEVRAPGQLTVLVSALPSAVLAVALR